MSAAVNKILKTTGMIRGLTCTAMLSSRQYPCWRFWQCACEASLPFIAAHHHHSCIILVHKHYLHRTGIGLVQQRAQIHTALFPWPGTKTTNRKNYRGITIPDGLLEKVRTIVETRKDLGYVSASEFIKEAIRRRVEEIERQASSGHRKQGRGQ